MEREFVSQSDWLVGAVMACGPGSRSCVNQGLGLLHCLSQCQLSWRQRSFLLSLGFAFDVADVVVIFDDRIRFEVSQVSQLRLAEAVVAQAFYNADDFWGGSQGAMGRAQ